MEDRLVEVEATVEAAPDRVWEAWASPRHIARWFVDEAKGTIGRSRSLTWVWREFGLEVVYDVIEVEPRKRLLLRGATPGGRPHELETTLMAEDGGRTRVRVAQSGFEPGEEGDEAAEAGRSGWVLALAVMREYVERHWGEERGGLLLMRPTRIALTELRRLFRTEAGLSLWLTRAGAVREEGSPVALRLRGGGEITGRVLRVTRDEAVVSWEEVNGVLELKTFPGERGRTAALRVTCWGNPPASLEREQRALEAALERLGALRPA